MFYCHLTHLSHRSHVLLSAHTLITQITCFTVSSHTYHTDHTLVARTFCSNPLVRGAGDVFRDPTSGDYTPYNRHQPFLKTCLVVKYIYTHLYLYFFIISRETMIAEQEYTKFILNLTEANTCIERRNLLFE